MAHLLSKNGHLVNDGGHLVSVTDPDDCDCCGSPVPPECNGYVNVLYKPRACATDWMSSYPAEGDGAAWNTYMNGTEVDVTLPDGFADDGSPGCIGTKCADLSGATFTLPRFGSGSAVWYQETANYCRTPGVLTMGVSLSCLGDECELRFNLVISNSSGAVTFLWRLVLANQIEFATLDELLPRNGTVTGVGSGVCTLTDIVSPVRVVKH